MPTSSRNVAKATPALVLSLLATLVACGGAQVQMQSSYPTPLVRPLPVHAGLVVDDAFAQYTHAESIEGFGDWSVSFGEDQHLMFEQTMRGVFARASRVDEAAPDVSGLDLIVKPRLAEFEMSIPQQTQTEFFEVRIVYQIQLLDARGTELVDWTVSAYGRSDTRNFESIGRGGSGPALAAATRTALRDASALISRQLPQQPNLQSWLERRPESE